MIDTRTMFVSPSDRLSLTLSFSPTGQEVPLDLGLVAEYMEVVERYESLMRKLWRLHEDARIAETVKEAWMGPNRPQPMTLEEKLTYFHDVAMGKIHDIEAAVDLVRNVDGAHHKQWIIDQMLRVLTGEDYDQWVADYEHCDTVFCPLHDGGDQDWDCDRGDKWDVGIAPQWGNPDGP